MTGMNKDDEARQPGPPGIVLSSNGLGVSGALVLCPFCGGAAGYRVHEGSTFRWRSLHCAACSEVVAEARNTANPHEIPTDSTPRYSVGDEAWNAAGAYAQGLRELADSEGTRAVEYLRRARKAEALLREAMATLTGPQAINWKDGMTEVEHLRQQQSDAVMPLIGPLLDALDGLANDTRGALEDEAPSLFDALAAIQRAIGYDA